MNKKQVNKSTKRLNKENLYKSIVESIDNTMKHHILAEDVEDDIEECDNVEEGELYELFGLGSDVKKPEVTLSVENTDEKNAEIFLQWCEYYMSKASSNIADGVSKIMNVCEKVLVKTPVIILKGILMVFSRSYKLGKLAANKIAYLTVLSYSCLVKLVKSGVKSADDVLTKLKNTLVSKAKAGYVSFKKNVDNTIKEASDNFTMWLGIASSLMMMVADNLEGAVDAFSDWVKSVINDVKEKSKAAALLVKSWITSKSESVKSYINKVSEDVKSNAVKVWKELDSSVRKAYNKIAESIEKWMSSLKDLVTEIGKKIDTAKEDAKAFVVDKKDKALVYGIQKAVKGLSNKYKEEEVVALVRKAYNESLKPDTKGNFYINECYFYERGSKPRKLFENHKKLVKRKRILS